MKVLQLHVSCFMEEQICPMSLHKCSDQETPGNMHAASSH